MEDRHETEYLIYERRKTGKKKTYDVIVCNKYGEHLANIYWRSTWRKYVFTPRPLIDFDTKCLDDISNYMKELLEIRKQERIKEKQGVE